METKRIVTLCVVVLCSLGTTMAQTEWVDHPANPVMERGVEGFRGELSAVVWDGSMYHMIFQGFDPAIDQRSLGHATSTDGVIWEMDPANPVLTPGPDGAWDGDITPSRVALIFENGEFQLWYSGCGDDRRHRVGYATSPDGTVWTKFWGNPVFDGGPAGSFDGHHVFPESVVYSGGAYRMWYTGIDQPSGHLSIGHAESTDGISWVRHPTPVVDSGPGWDWRDVAEPTVVFDGSMYQMWYSGAGPLFYQIGYASSIDGINWTKPIEHPVISLADGASSPEVVFDGSTFHMWYLDGGQWWDPDPPVVNYAISDCCRPMTSVLFIPAAACAAGAQGSFFQTDVDLNNSGDRPVEYEIQWLERGRDPSERRDSATFTLGAGMSVRYGNVVAEIFGHETDALGALTIVSSSSDLLAMSRTYNVAAGESAGTFGQAVPAVPLDDLVTAGERRRILLASENEGLRFNVGCQNGTAQTVAVSLDLFDDEGSFLERKAILLPPLGNRQINRIFEDYMPVEGYVDVRSDTHGALFYCYGSVVDNRTNDPTTILPQ